MMIPQPKGSALVEVTSGVWLKPRLVTSISVIRNGHLDTKRPQVEIRCAGIPMLFDFDSLEACSKFARRVASGCNWEMGFKSDTVADFEPGVQERTA